MIQIKQFNATPNNFDDTRMHSGYLNSRGEFVKFASPLEAYKFAEQHFIAYNVYIDGILQSVEEGTKLLKSSKEDGSYYKV